MAEFTGLLGDALGYMQDPVRTPQMRMLGGLLSSSLTSLDESDKRYQALYKKAFSDKKNPMRVTDPDALAELTSMTMSGPMGMANAGVTKLAVAPFVGKAIRATEGLPVGGSIKFIDLNKGIYKPELTMEEMLKVKDIPTVERVKQSLDLVGDKTFENMVNAQFKKYQPTNESQEALLVESVTLEILGRAQRSPYPQVEALRLAQQRAALPVEQGGLGLLESNTAMDRAKAMGTDVETSYIHSTSNPFTKINEDGKFSGIFTLPNYSANYGTLNMPLVARGEIATSDDLRRLVKRPTKKMQMAIDERIPENVDIADATVEMQKLRNELARKYGFSGVKVSDEFGQDTTALVNPENIRSRFASFDPFRRTAATAAAMGVAAPDLLATEMQEELKRRQLRGLLAP